MSRSQHTGGLVDRIVRDATTARDRAHAATCATCAPILARAATFDEELRTSARSLVVERLPAGILETAIAGAPAARVLWRRPAPGFAAILTAMAVLVAATVIALGPGSTPAPSPSETAAPTERPARTITPLADRFRATNAIRAQLGKLDYGCIEGDTYPSPGPEPGAVVRDAAVCMAPDSIGPIILAAIVGESATGMVVMVAVKGDLAGGDTPENRATFADAVAKVFALALLDEGAQVGGGSWVRTHVPELELGDRVDVALRGVAFHAELGEHGYYVSARSVRSG